MTTSLSQSPTHDAIRAELEETRERTLLLVSDLSNEDLTRQHSDLMSPIVWDLAHIAHFEELWLTRNLDGPIEFVEMPGLFNPMENPRNVRGSLELPDLADCVDLMARIRERVLNRLNGVDFKSGSALARDGFVYHLVIQHEAQHNETMLQTLQLKLGEPYQPPARRELPRRGPEITDSEVAFPGGVVTIGTDRRVDTYDNERPQHSVQLDPFYIDAFPVTNGAYLEFINEDGYRRPELWTDQGAAWLSETGAKSPAYWTMRDGTWRVRTMDREGPVELDHPVCHVSYYEAEAFARFVGKRLPTEQEWEVAALWDPANDCTRAFPWGNEPADPNRANIDQLGFGTAPVGSYPQGVSPLGCHGMIGDVWEWTSSWFTGYPGFEAYPYPEYSEAFFGSDYRVLRGGSWATRPSAIRGTFRNWDYPIRRQIFSGFRCARDG